MASAFDNTPTRPQLENQLSKILGSETFRKRPTLRRLLEYIVISALEGKKLTAKLIAFDLFPASRDRRPNDNPFTGVQANASLLRTRLAEYYIGEGLEDPFIIEVPPGESYGAVFSINSRHPVGKFYHRGLYRLSKVFSCYEVEYGLSDLMQAFDCDPCSASVNAALAHAHLINIPYRYIPQLGSARYRARYALELNPDTWLAHIVLGAVYSCHWEWDDARQSFEAASRIAPLQTRSHFWYVVFLLATGKRQEALQIVTELARTGTSDPIVLTFYGLVLYVTRDFETAEEVLSDAMDMDRLNWVAYLIGVCIDFARGRLDDAFYALLDQKHCMEMPSYLLGQEAKAGCYGGLLLLCLGLLNRRPLARRMLAGFNNTARHNLHPLHFVSAGIKGSHFRRNCWEPLPPILDFKHTLPYHRETAGGE